MSNAPLESMSEAIGERFKKKIESQLKPREKSIPDEPRTSTPKSQEKTKPKTPSNKERKERIGPKIDMKHPEVRAEKIDSKKILRELVNGEYSALKKKEDFPQRMREAEAHQDARGRVHR